MYRNGISKYGYVCKMCMFALCALIQCALIQYEMSVKKKQFIKKSHMSKGLCIYITYE